MPHKRLSRTKGPITPSPIDIAVSDILHRRGVEPTPEKQCSNGSSNRAAPPVPTKISTDPFPSVERLRRRLGRSLAAGKRGRETRQAVASRGQGAWTVGGCASRNLLLVYLTMQAGLGSGETMIARNMHKLRVEGARAPAHMGATLWPSRRWKLPEVNSRAAILFSVSTADSAKPLAYYATPRRLDPGGVDF